MNIIDTTGMLDAMEIVGKFDTISLGEMDAVKLLNRQDVKFTFHMDLLAGVLEKLSPSYRVLSIDGNLISRYETRYFDTPDLLMYVQHHNGKLNRHKVRFREYLDSGLRYFEIKFKSNKGRTIKDRIKLLEPGFTIEGEKEKFLRKKTTFEPGMLKQSIEVRYSRITLVQKNLKERVTFDVMLNYRMEGKEESFPELVIAEVKQDRSSRSPFTVLMQDYFIAPFSLSKYCLGIASLNDEVKKNNFKPKLLHVKKLCNGNP